MTQEHKCFCSLSYSHWLKKSEFNIQNCARTLSYFLNCCSSLSMAAPTPLVTSPWWLVSSLFPSFAFSMSFSCNQPRGKQTVAPRTEPSKTFRARQARDPGMIKPKTAAVAEPAPTTLKTSCTPRVSAKKFCRLKKEAVNIPRRIPPIREPRVTRMNLFSIASRINLCCSRLSCVLPIFNITSASLLTEAEASLLPPYSNPAKTPTTVAVPQLGFPANLEELPGIGSSGFSTASIDQTVSSLNCKQRKMNLESPSPPLSLSPSVLLKPPGTKSVTLAERVAMDAAHCYLEGNADAVEFCPHEPYANLLAASTYTLQEGDCPSRSGSVYLFDVGDVEDVGLNLIQKIDTAGVFDIRWSRCGDGGGSVALAQADADGCLRVYKIDETEVKGYSFKEVCGEKISSSMCLCLDWDPSSTSIVVGLSDGSASVVSFTDSNLETVQEWKGHDFELWTASFDLNNPNLVYTGSDDCKFSCWDIRDSPADNRVFQNSKVHTMGVCCISPSPNDPYSIFTGSYDETLRVWDMRSVSRPVNETSLSLGGGVWRIKHHPFLRGVVLAACIHNGFAVAKVSDGKAEMLESYNKHESLAYGADWYRGKDLKQSVVATCSFYDRLLRLWTPENDLSTST